MLQEQGPPVKPFRVQTGLKVFKFYWREDLWLKVKLISRDILLNKHTKNIVKM